MIEPRGRSGGLRLFHGVALVAVFVVAAVVIGYIVSVVVGVLFKIIEIALVAAVVFFAVRLVARRARRHRG